MYTIQVKHCKDTQIYAHLTETIMGPKILIDRNYNKNKYKRKLQIKLLENIFNYFTTKCICVS